MQTEVVILENGKISFFDAFQMFRLRMEVFCAEQRCWYVDPDEHDFTATHILIYLIDENLPKKLVAYARIYKKDGQYVIGRVCTHLLFRRKGLGKKVMEIAIAQCPPKSVIYIQAQAYLKRFYENFGFVQQGSEIIWEDGIAHIPMIKIKT
ncbi:MAG: GNAT family N-acetyltransferase [Bacteroidia bacterium]|nr:GNAT family N-acetyltransferase [Bacteroidia bacterium]MDW8302499.1 GNAT family N-acetyltransferase [Bacteroidia bacterium]